MASAPSPTRSPRTSDLERPLPLLEPVTVTLTSGVLDAKGTPLWGYYSWTFGCDRQWSAPLWVLDNVSPLSISFPQVSLSDTGRAIVVWSVNQEWVESSRCELSTGGCTAPETLGDNSDGFDLAGNGAGQVIVVGRGTSSLWSRAFDPATQSWRPMSTVASIGLAAKSALDVSMDALGNATVIWRERGPEHDEIKVRRYLWQASAWEPATVLETSDLHAIQVRVAENSSGKAVALWGLAQGIDGSLVASHNEGNGWAEPARITGECPETKFSVDIDQAGNAIVVWDDDGDRSPGLWSSRLASGTGAWTPPFKMDPMCCCEYPQARMRGPGRPTTGRPRRSGESRPLPWTRRAT